MNPNHPVVSVIVPVYNAGAFLRRTLDCICGQTLHEIEIILVDDGSTDDSRSIQQEYAERDSRIILLQQEHEYAGAARNKGMAIARGKYLSFLDADDLFEPTMLEKMVARAEATGAELVICKADALSVTGEYQPLRIQLKGFYPHGLNKTRFHAAKEMPQLVCAFQPWAWDKLFRADYVQRLNLSFGNTRRVNDILFVYPATAAARICSIIDDEVLVHYRESGQQLSSAKSLGQDATDMVSNAAATYHKMAEIGISGAMMTAFCCRMASSLGWTVTQFCGKQRDELITAIQAFESEFHLLPDIESAMRRDAFAQCIRECRNNLYLYAAITQPEAYCVTDVAGHGGYRISATAAAERPLTDKLAKKEKKSRFFSVEKDTYYKYITCCGLRLRFMRGQTRKQQKRARAVLARMEPEKIEKLMQADVSQLVAISQALRTPHINRDEVASKVENMRGSGISGREGEPELVVSITSYPARMYDLHLCLYSLLTQSHKPDKVILWLAAEQFPERELDVPLKVRELCRHGLEIRWCPDYRSYKKIIPALAEYPGAAIVTADDDLFYAPDWLEKLWRAYEAGGRRGIYAHRCHLMKLNGCRVAPYREWRKCLTESEPGPRLFPTTGGGVLYAPHSLHPEVQNIQKARLLCPAADDIWLWGMGVMNGTPVRILPNPHSAITVTNPWRESNLNGDGTLYHSNMAGENDKQLQKLLAAYPCILSNLTNDIFSSAV